MPHLFPSSTNVATDSPDNQPVPPEATQPPAHPGLDDQPDEEPVEEGGMTLIEHLEDLRTAILRSFFALLISFGIVFSFLFNFVDLLNWPVEFASGVPASDFLIVNSPMAIFSVIVQIGLLGGIAIALPFILYFMGTFIAPGLNAKEKMILIPGCGTGLVLFLIGAIFSFLILVPASLKASIFLTEMMGYKPLWTADKYYGLLVWMVLGVGLCFQFPLIVVLLVYVELVTAKKLAELRPYSIVAFLMLAALVTPTTDPLTFLLLAIPMSVLYELSIIAGRRVEKWRLKQVDV